MPEAPSSKMNNLKIPPDLKKRLMTNLGVSGDVLDATLKETQESCEVTPFISYTQEMGDTFKADNSAMTQFEKAATEEDKLKLVYKKMTIHPAHRNIQHLFPDQIDLRDANKSKSIRDEGNKLFQSKDFEAALDKFTEAMLLAPVKVKQTIDNDGSTKVSFTSKELSLAVARRATVFLDIGSHQKECLEDIETAFYFGHPQELNYRLFELQVKCFLQQGRQLEAQEGIEMAAQAARQGSMNEEARIQFIKDLQSLQTAVSLPGIDNYGDPIKLKLEKEPKIELPTIIGATEGLSILSEAVKVTKNGSRWKSVTALRNIDPGEVLVIDKPSTWFLSSTRWGSNCHHCCRPLCYTLVPSPLQPNAIFCCIKCCHEAMESYHVQESKLNLRGVFELTPHSLFENSKKSFNGSSAKRTSDPLSSAALLALRTLVDPTRSSKESEQDVIEESNLDKMALVPYKDNVKTDPDLLLVLMRTVFLIQVLNFIKYFKKDDTKKSKGEMSADELQAGLKLMILQKKFALKNLSITQCEHELSPGQPLQLTEIGSAVYPFIGSCVQHSCDPNTAKIFYGNQIILVAKRCISKGDEISFSLGPHYSNLVKVVRQAKLRTMLNVDCQCQACQEDFPLLKNLPDHLLKIETFPKFKNPLRILKKFQAEIDSNRWNEAKFQCCQYLKLLTELEINNPDKAFEAGSHALSCVLWKLHGNFLHLDEEDSNDSDDSDD